MSGANAHGGTTRTAGVDLAARPTGTASCVLAWTTDGFWIEELACGGVEDPVILELVARDNIGVVGIDVPFGWPEAYVQAVSRHHWGLRPSLDEPTTAPADELRYRQTDRCLMQEVPGTRPLSASLDPLAACVVRAARILGEAESRGYPIDRTGRVGPVAEVYPAASARVWGLDVMLKRRREESRQERLDRLRIALPDALAPAGFTGPTEVFDDPSLSLHAIDALLAALTARAVLGAATRYPHSDEHDLASREGWIHWPAGAVDDLPALPVASDR